MTRQLIFFTFIKSKPMNNSISFKAGIEAAKAGRNINNSYPFDYEDFVNGYKTIKPFAKTMLDNCKTPEDRLSMLSVIKQVIAM